MEIREQSLSKRYRTVRAAIYTLAHNKRKLERCGDSYPDAGLGPPDAANLNWYSHRSPGLQWHADNEWCFRTPIEALGVSWGCDAVFEVRRNGTGNPYPRKLVVENGPARR